MTNRELFLHFIGVQEERLELAMMSKVCSWKKRT